VFCKIYVIIKVFDLNNDSHVRLCHYGMACPQVADGEDGLQTWSTAANVFSKQSRTAEKCWSSSLGVVRGNKQFLTVKIKAC